MGERDQSVTRPLGQRLEEIDWSKYFVFGGTAESIPEYLKRLRSQNEQEVLSAKHDLWVAFFHEHLDASSVNLPPHVLLSLWCGVCQAGVYTPSAALPALSFLLDLLDSGSDLLKDSVLDILMGFTIATDPKWIDKVNRAVGCKQPVTRHWLSGLRSALTAELQRIAPLRMHPDADIADSARRIIRDLKGASQESPDLSLAAFAAAATELAQFAVKNDYPPTLLWVGAGDVVVAPWRSARTCFVWKGDPTERDKLAGAEFQAAVARHVGVSVEARCKTGPWTICRLYVPVDSLDAERRMIPQVGVKMSVANEPLPTVLVQSRLLWRVLKWWRRNAPPARD